MKPVLHKGQLKKWNDERGFGFIKPSDGGKDVFLHISALREASRRPQVGDIIFYKLTTEADGKIRASNASILGVAPRSVPKKHKRKKQGRKKPGKLVSWLVGGVIVAISLLSRVLSDYHSPSSVTSNNTPITNVSVPKPGCNIKGNISMNTGNKIYHLPGMEDYGSTKIDTSRGEKWFCTESEAIQSGWRKAPR